MRYDKNGKGHFSPKEEKVIALVSKGFKNAEIVKRVYTTEHVVKNILRKVYDVLGFYNRVELAMWYVKRKHDGDIKEWL